jgi:hypothetical protein
LSAIELHRQKQPTSSTPNGNFLKSAFVASGAARPQHGRRAAAPDLSGGRASAPRPGRPTYHYLPVTADTAHWGYFSKLPGRRSKSIPATTSPSKR